jgi:hypothetical protein
VSSETTGAWLVICLSAWADGRAEAGELVASAASALQTVASNAGSQYSGKLELLTEFGTKLWQLLESGLRNCSAAGYPGTATSRPPWIFARESCGWKEVSAGACQAL